jgi:ubiquitin-like 1-activating enzyme E1 A
MRAEAEAGRAVGPADAPVLRATATALCQAEGLEAGAVSEQALEAYGASAEEMPAINAVVGGVVANELLKAASQKGEPLVNNLFLYSLADGSGWVERAG